MLQFELNAQPRQKFGKGAARQMRKAGLTPAVLYGKKGAEGLSLQIETKPFTKALLTIQGQNAVVTVNVDGDAARHVMVQDLQVDPITDVLLHADLYEIDVEDAITLSVPLVYKGKPKGVDMGGESTVWKSSIVLKGKVLDIPDNVVINVAPLSLDEKITCADIELPASVALQDAGDDVCFSVQAARAALVKTEDKEK